MPTQDDTRQLAEAARAAIDEDALAEVLALAAERECGEDAPVALREVVVDELVADALAAAAHARHRGRGPTGDDVGAAADQRHGHRQNLRESSGPPMQPGHTWVESS